MKRILCWRWWLLGVLPLLAACASLPAIPSPPQLRLSPASFGGAVALQQQLTVTARGATHTLEAILEVDPSSVRLAVVSLGQTAARLEWDGTTLTQSRADWWPAAVSGERILGDLQLMVWPAEAIRAALPQGWTLDADANQRTLRFGGEPVARVNYLSASQSELKQMRDGYAIKVDSRNLGSGS